MWWPCVTVSDEYTICDKNLTKQETVQTAQELAALSELTALTFENNRVQDQESVCVLFKNLQNFQKLENLNIRQNRFNSQIMQALCEGIAGKRELRVSGNFG